MAVKILRNGKFIFQKRYYYQLPSTSRIIDYNRDTCKCSLSLILNSNDPKRKPNLFKKYLSTGLWVLCSVWTLNLRLNTTQSIDLNFTFIINTENFVMRTRLYVNAKCPRYQSCGITRPASWSPFLDNASWSAILLMIYFWHNLAHLFLKTGVGSVTLVTYNIRYLVSACIVVVHSLRNENRYHLG